MLNIGCHLSTTKGYENMGKEAIKIGANTFQYFTRNPRGGKAKDIDEKELKIFNKVLDKMRMKKDGFRGSCPFEVLLKLRSRGLADDVYKKAAVGEKADAE